MSISKKTDKKIIGAVRRSLFPDFKWLLSKVLFIHVFTSLLTLLVCPQMGFSLIKSKFNLMDLFMKVGPQFCDFACGAFFTSVSVSFIFLLLSRDEFRFLRYKPFIMISVMMLSSLGFLLMLNPDLFVQLTLLWVVGALAGILGAMEIGFRLQSKQV